MPRWLVGLVSAIVVAVALTLFLVSVGLWALLFLL